MTEQNPGEQPGEVSDPTTEPAAAEPTREIPPPRAPEAALTDATELLPVVQRAQSPVAADATVVLPVFRAESADATTVLPVITHASAPTSSASPAPPDNKGRAAIIIGTAVLLAAMVGAAVYAASGPVPNSVPTTDLPSWRAGASAEATAGASSPKTLPSPSRSVSPSPSITANPMSGLLVGPHTVKINASGWWSWALMDLRTGKIYGSKNLHGTSKTASMIKAWIGADFLRREAEAGRTPSSDRLHQVSIMIRDSDNTSATSLFSAVGKSASTRRMISMCGLTDSVASDNWSNTLVSPADAVRLGACINNGRAAGSKWTKWLINEMRLVRGTGDFGIRKAFSSSIQSMIAIKNGWVTRSATNEWNVNCLAIGSGWSMAVETRYPVSLGMTYGTNICKQIAAQLKN